ncbi:endonuclease/exonuclease/phosphatase family protein [Virgisporangium aurantiacum]|uniref:Endonuclease n=1 Tax=Virgisporangium aurantiacum TaxID=175570 RepID=A0A8J3ZDC0_9ACTN|nr:endonuclease/exonuclease/phosphatase family protein [Virgisporangium aurantiacum]GIJ61892.1 endonuclease [Virgisporangium aurantiacum]
MRILTFNVQNDEGDPRRTGLINRELRRLAPDVVALQEVRFPGQLQQLLAGTGLTATHQQQVLPNSPDEYGGTAVATKWPHTVEEVSESEPGARFHWWTLTVVTSNDLRIVAPTTPWEPDAAAARESQARRIRGSGRTIVAGDLNATPGSASIRLIRKIFVDAWERAGSGPGDTWTAGRIDYVFVSPDLEVTAARRIGTAPVDGVRLSDHYGVLADVNHVEERGGGAA